MFMARPTPAVFWNRPTIECPFGNGTASAAGNNTILLQQQQGVGTACIQDASTREHRSQRLCGARNLSPKRPNLLPGTCGCQWLVRLVTLGRSFICGYTEHFTVVKAGIPFRHWFMNCIENFKSMFLFTTEQSWRYCPSQRDFGQRAT